MLVTSCCRLLLPSPLCRAERDPQAVSQKAFPILALVRYFVLFGKKKKKKELIDYLKKII